MKSLRFQMKTHPCKPDIKATSQLTIFMREISAKGKIQRNHYQDGQQGTPFAGRTSSVPLIAYTHPRKIAE